MIDHCAYHTQKRGGKQLKKIVISDNDPFNLAPEEVSGATASAGGTAGGSQPGSARQPDAVKGGLETSCGTPSRSRTKIDQHRITLTQETRARYLFYHFPVVI